MKRALVIDDDPCFRELLARLLAVEFDVRLAFDGESALSVLASDVPDVVLLDVVLPRTTGSQVLEALRADPRTSGLPVVAFSAGPLGGAVAEAFLRRGGVDCLVDKLSPPRVFLDATRRAAGAH